MLNITSNNILYNLHQSRSLLKKILAILSLLVTSTLSIGNHMISSAIWDKSARVNFSKTKKIARARRASAICSL